MIDLDKLSALEKAATPGPWYAWLDPNNNIEDKCITTIPEEQYIREYNALCGKRWLESNEEVIGCSEWMRAEDADFLLIVEMRNQLPDLIACIDQQATRIKELDDAVSGPLENITKLLETVNADTIFAGVIQTWKNENQTLKSQIADLEKRNADLEARIGHEQVVTMQDREAQLQRYIRELEAQVTALKEIAEDERAYILSANVMESTGVDEFLRTEARRQLTEKYPEAFK